MSIRTIIKIQYGYKPVYRFLTFYISGFGHWSCALCLIHALNPFSRELQGPEGTVTQTWADASSIWSFLTPALQMFAKEPMCFIPYWDRDPQCVSKVLTYTWLIRAQLYIGVIMFRNPIFFTTTDITYCN